MPNRLADETSPYLLQHRDNPVQWYPWGPDALELARQRQLPIFLSIGYSACHWCHVMEHESFENDEIAAVLNKHFVSVKVDREERPDLDQIYMNAVQMMTGRGGWPMSVFLTPDREPFFAGTYWPPEPRMGMPGFQQILIAIVDAWENRRDQAVESARRIADRVRQIEEVSAEADELSITCLDAAAAELERVFDYTHGGFGGAPKFPHSIDLQVLLRQWRHKQREDVLSLVQLSLDKMASGGMYDHLGGGFARYSTDDRWLVPHFEKMLYDNALLATVYLEAFTATGQPGYAQVVRETLDYVLRDMTDAAGGFYSAEDADSEGVEGKFYVWTRAEIDEALGAADADLFAYVYDVSEPGNFEGANILNLPKTFAQCAALKGMEETDLASRMQRCRETLLEVRDRRPRPGRDDKVLVSWNGLMIDAMARAGCTLDEPRYCAAASAAADFLLKNLRRDGRRLLHTWRNGTAKIDAYLDDYAALIGALVSVYEATFEPRMVDEAVRLADEMLTHFSEPQGGALYFTADDHEALIVRYKPMQDGSIPSGNALATHTLHRLAMLTGAVRFSSAAEATLRDAAGLIQHAPRAAGQFLLALDDYLGPFTEIVICGDPQQQATRDVLQALRGYFLPNKVIAVKSSREGTPAPRALEKMFAGKETLGDGPTVYVCQGASCQAPVTGRDAILARWAQLESEIR